MTRKNKTIERFVPPDQPGFRIDDYPLYNLNRTSWTYIEEMSKILKTIDMDQPRWRVLSLLDDKNPSTVSELSRRAVTKLSTLTRIVIRMEEEGLVRRAPAPTDSRVTEVFITERGRAALGPIQAIAGRVYRKAMEGLDDAEIVEFVRILKHIRENLARSPYLG